MGKCGGLCEFKGCNKILVKEYLTATESNISNFTHIIAKSEKRLRENKFYVWNWKDEKQKKIERFL